MKMLHRLSAVVMGVLLAGCATTVPEPIREVPPGNPSPVEVRANPEQFVGNRVRWGGTITGVKNRQRETWIEIVARPLNDSGRPENGDISFGRFLAKLEGFVDPAIYSEGREITVVGTLAEPARQTIGEYPYLYPVVEVSSRHLWAVEPAYRGRYYDPFWYDPWYDPWYPFHPWPYGPYRPYW